MNSFYRTILFIIICWQASFVAFAQTDLTKELRTALKEAKHDTAKVTVLVAYSNAFYTSQPDTVIPICLEAIAIIDKNLPTANAIEKKSFLNTKAGALNNIAATYKIQGDILQAMNYFNTCVDLYREIGEKRGLAHTLNNIGAIYDNQGDIAKALDYFSQSLKLLEEIDDKKAMAASLNNIGFIYSNQGNVTEAVNYYNKSLKLRESIGDKKGIANSLSNIGGVYKTQGDFDKALSYWDKSLKIREELGDKKGMANSLTNMAGVYQTQGDPSCRSQIKSECLSAGIQLALVNYERSLQLRKEVEDKQGMAGVLNNISGLYFLLQKFSMASEYADNSLLLSTELGFPENLKLAEYSLARIDSATRNFTSALKHYKNYILFRDSINNEQTRKASIKNQLNYEFTKKEAVIKEQQEKERAVAEEKNRFQKIVIASVLIGLLIVIIFAVFVMRSLKTTRQQKEIIEEKQKEILDSIYYARRIQRALMPHEKYVQKSLNRLQNKP